VSEEMIFLMSPPRRDWALRGRQNFRSRQADAVDAGAARREWSLLADTIVEAGGHVLVLPPDPHQALTGMIYTAEAGEFYRDDEDRACWILPHMAAPHRVDEAAWIARFLDRFGVTMWRPEARWEAQGDAIRAGEGRIIHTFGSGPDARTERGAYSAVAEFLSAEHLALEFIADPWFHGNTFLNVYAPRRGARLVFVCEDALVGDGYRTLEQALGDVEFVDITREESLAYATNALQVDDTIIAPSGISSRLVGVWERAGFEVVSLDLGQLFGRGGGAPVCLTNRLWGARRQDFEDPSRDVFWRSGAAIDDFRA